MTGGLLRPVELDGDGDGSENLPGFRLDRLELYNWGTFDQRVWTFRIGGRNGLLTGDIGSGKSTIVDAVTTLLLPANRISYNKAAGAEARERDLRSYVLGHHKSQRNEETGSSQPVALRDAGSFSVLLGVFTNLGYDTTVTCAQVFWMKDARQPDRFYATADRDLSVVGDFADFGSDIGALKRRLRASGARTFDAFPEYGRDFRRRLGIESEQAMELFHQTVSMKAVSDLNEFVRHHMLEPFDAATWTAKLISHFDDLTSAHDAVQRAQRQLAALVPLLADCDVHDRVRDEMNALDGQRSALRFFFAERKAGLLSGQIDTLQQEKDLQQGILDAHKVSLAQLRKREAGLNRERDGKGGTRLGEIDQEVLDAERLKEERRQHAQRFATRLTAVGLGPVQTAAQFAGRRPEIERAKTAAADSRADIQDTLDRLGADQKELDRVGEGLRTELKSLRTRRSSIPHQILELRNRLCRELDLTEGELPFAGELIQVRPAESRWEGAAERLLHGFALSLLVTDEQYPAVSDWINEHHLGTRLVYYRVPAAVGAWTGTGDGGDLLAGKLEIKDCAFSPWLERELAFRAGYTCVETMADFRRAPKAITRAGQFKGSGGRHEKNDTTRIDDRSSYVLGWTNEQKIDALLARAAAHQHRKNTLDAELEELKKSRDDSFTQEYDLGLLAEITEFTTLDWQSQVRLISDLEEERRRLQASSRELERLTEELDRTIAEIHRIEAEKEQAAELIGKVRGELDTAERHAATAARILADPGCPPARQYFTDLAQRFPDDPAVGPEDCDRAENQARIDLTELLDRRAKRQNTIVSRITSQMNDFRKAYQVETAELDDSVRSAPGYRELHRRLVDDDLPRFQQRFKTYLNTNTIRDIASFNSQLSKQEELIKQRVGIINESLLSVEYNPGRYIQLEARPSPSTEIRDFRTELRECTANALSSDASDQYSEEKFLQVSRIIERFKGREGQTGADKEWTKRVTDVRNWFVFSASERWRKDDTEHETYADTGGKSGGQKEKLAYTILAASLAYQFKLDWGATRSKTFRFAVIDEAFGRGSDESTRFALKLFRSLGLQLMIVTPLQKIHVIEPYVAAVGYVDNPDGKFSRLQTLTIQEYKARQIAHLLAEQAEP